MWSWIGTVLHFLLGQKAKRAKLAHQRAGFSGGLHVGNDPRMIN